MNEGELLVISKTYDLVKWSCEHTARFPRSHRFVLGERMERQLYGLLEVLIRAKYSRDRVGLLTEANMGLEVYRFQVRLARDLGCLKGSSYEFAAKQILEIGQQIGGWLKQAHGPKPGPAGRRDETAR